MSDLIRRQDAIDAVADLYWMDERLLNFKKEIDATFDKIKALPSAQPELIEQGAYVRGFEQGRTQGMIDNTIKAEWTNADALDLQPTCNRLATDCVSRKAAIDSIEKHLRFGDELYPLTDTDKVLNHAFSIAASCVYNLPSAQPEIKPIDYQDCANAMLRMWMDKVVTDGEYNRIMDKLNAFWGTRNERSDRQTGGDGRDFQTADI